MYKYCMYLLLFTSFYVVCEDDDDRDLDLNVDEENDLIPDIFVATHEWKIVKKGQKIPAGLHVRTNFQTGITEAKILDPSESDDKSGAIAEINSENSGNDEKLTPEEINKITKQYKSYEQIKKELSDMNLIPKVDADLLKSLLNNHKKEMDEEEIDTNEIITILEDLDLLVHQYDNALDFVKFDGFNVLVLPNLNSTDKKIKQETLKLVVSLTQNNPAVQQSALESGIVPILLRILTFETDLSIKLRAVSAIGAILRRFPLAQQAFIKHGGPMVVIKILEDSNVVIKLKIKVTTFIGDIMFEPLFIDSDLSNYDEIVKLYKKIDLEKILLENNFCSHLNKLLYTVVVNDKDDHVSVEYCLYTMSAFAMKCGPEYSVELLQKLMERYKILASEITDKEDESNMSEVYVELSRLIVELLKYTKNNKNEKTEL